MEKNNEFKDIVDEIIEESKDIESEKSAWRYLVDSLREELDGYRNKLDEEASDNL